MNRQLLTASATTFINETAGVQCDERAANFMRTALLAEVKAAVRTVGIPSAKTPQDIPDTTCFDIAEALRRRSGVLSESSPTIKPLLRGEVQKAAPILIVLTQGALLDLADIFEPSGEFPVVSATAS